MSSKKRPLRELSQAPQTPRYAPSTPHAIRALQRSGAAQRSTRINKLRPDAQRPDSARGILRRLAQITAPVTKRRVSTPIGKENVQSASTGKKAFDLAEEDGEVEDRPDFTLPLVEENGWDEEVDSDLGEAPTPSALPGGDDDPTITFQSIRVASEARQSMSEGLRSKVLRRSSLLGEEEDGEHDREIEIGRRAVSEGPIDRYPRSSFGSIRMSGFGLDQPKRLSEQGNGNETGFGADDGYDIGLGFGDDHELDHDNETEDFRRHRRSPSVPNELNIEEDIIDDDTFRLEIAAQEEAHGLQSAMLPSTSNVDEDGYELDGELDGELDQGVESLSPSPDSPQNKTRPLTPMEAAAARKPRRKKTKLNRHGIAIPALPSSLIKRVAIETMTRRGKRKPTIDRASLQALEQATEWFFEQVGEDLEAYSQHAGRRKRIDASDVLTLMRRQRVLKGDGKLGDFAIEHLPPEALRELDLPDTL